MLTRLERINPPKSGRLIAISDIHGHRELFDRLLEKLNFSPADTLVIVGDMLERGSDSLGMIRRAMELHERGNVHVLIGNVDLWSLAHVTGERGRTGADVIRYVNGLLDWCGSNLFYEMCREAGIEFRDDMDVDAARGVICEKFRAEIEFMYSLPTFLETPEYMFVHGGVPSGELDKYVGQEPWAFLKNDAFIERGVKFDKYLIVGHWPANLYRPDHVNYAPYIERSRKIIDIDGGTGIKEAGQLNALILPRDGGEFDWVCVDELTEMRALDAQAPSGDTFALRWGHNEVDVLREEGDVALLFNPESEREFWAPVRLLYDRREGEARCFCGDVSTYELEVQPGDALRVFMHTSRGYIAKKGDVFGWYRGRAE